MDSQRVLWASIRGTVIDSVPLNQPGRDADRADDRWNFSWNPLCETNAQFHFWSKRFRLEDQTLFRLSLYCSIQGLSLKTLYIVIDAFNFKRPIKSKIGYSQVLTIFCHGFKVKEMWNKRINTQRLRLGGRNAKIVWNSILWKTGFFLSLNQNSMKNYMM